MRCGSVTVQSPPYCLHCRYKKDCCSMPGSASKPAATTLSPALISEVRLMSNRLKDALETLLRRHPQLAAVFDVQQGAALQILPLLDEGSSLRHWPWKRCNLRRMR